MVEPLVAFSREDTQQSIASRFRQVLRRVPDRPAIRDDGRVHTYAELDHWSGRIAAALRRHWDGDQPTVGILLPHDATALVGLLGVAKSGAIYAPLDVAWPEAHLDELLCDAQATTVLTDQQGAGVLHQLPAWRGRILSIDEALDDPAEFSASEASSPHQPACIYYSSGSTGKPKGIVLSHLSVLTEAYNYARAVGITATDRLVWLSPLGFGASKLPIFGGLMSGACVLPFSVQRQGLRVLAEWMQGEGVSLFSSVTTLFREFAGQLPDGENVPDLRAVKLGGEPVLRADADLFRRKFHRRCALVNGLGISEAAGNVCFYRWNGGAFPEGPTLPLGYPVEGVEIIIFDDRARPVPAGRAGEIAVRARHLALGYWRMPELTRAKFIEPTSGDRARLFLTGDLGQLSSDGCLIGLGRKDGTRKIRGHKVDTAEVDAAVLALGGVAQVATVAREFPSGPKLVSFIVPAPGTSPSTPEIHRKLRRQLPDFMIPSRFVHVPSLPLLPNGKVDGRALASIDLPSRDSRSRVEPRDPLERQLSHVWGKVLGVKDLGVTDDFFELGGDSLDAVRIFAMMERWLRVNLPLTELARHPTIESLARAIRENDVPAARSSAILLNAGESRLPFFCVPGAGSDAFALLDLSRCLGPEQTFHALQYPGIDGTRPRFLTVEQMAGRFLKDIRAIQPRGPYCLGGTSFGGLVAYEMARQLEAAGERVALLALLDTYGPGYPALRTEAVLQHLPLVVLRWLLPLGRKEERTWANLRMGIRERWNRLRAVGDLALSFRQSPPPYELRFIYLQEICFRAHRGYPFPPYDGPIRLFRVEQQPPGFLYDVSEDMGWRQVSRGGLEIIPIPGYHGAHIREPHVRTLAAKLGAKLAEASQRPQGRFEELTPRTREIWDQLGTWWDRQVGEEGSPESRGLLVPAVDRLLGVRAGERILDVGCGNGWYARRLARSGASVVGFDFSEVLIEHAQARTAEMNLDVTYHVLDATQREPLLKLGERSFDAAICLMALMDMTDVEPLFAALSRLLKPGGRFVFSIVHPGAGNLAKASPSQPLTNIGINGQPIAHYYFHRPIAMILDLAKRSGLEIDAEEEPGAEHLDYVPNLAHMAFFVGRMRLSGNAARRR